MQIQKFTFNPVSENTYVLWDETGECAIVDPGNYDSNENHILRDFIEGNNLRPQILLNTHAHIDHIFGNWYVKQTWDIPYLLHEEDLPMLDRSEQMAALWQMPYTKSPLPDSYLEPGTTISLGNEKLEIRFVPGHAPGHVVFVNHTDKTIIAGDTLFYESIGRTDLPGGDHQTLLQAIKEELFSLPDDYKVYCGHGPETTIGHEKKHNPFLRG